MAGLGSAVEIALRIKADSEDARKDFKRFRSELEDIDKQAKESGSVLERLGFSAGLSAQQFDTLKVGALAAVAGIGAIVGAATTAAVAIFGLAKSTSDFGSELFDAQAKTGLSAETLSTLKANADKAGSSFDEIAGAMTKFSILLGEAQNGNEKANETLSTYGITARDTATALDQAVSVIGAMETAERKSAAAKDLFKDRSAAIIPVIDQMKGSLSGATEEATRLGQTMSQSAIEASDDFGDALTDLQAQAAAVGREFGSEMMPSITSAMKTISDVMAENKGIAGSWAAALVKEAGDVARGFKVMGDTVDAALKISTLGLYGNTQSASAWSIATRTAIDVVLGPIYSLIQRLGEAKAAYDRFFGAGEPKREPGVIGSRIGGAFGPPAPVDAPISRGSRGGSRSPARSNDPAIEAERLRKEAVAAAQRQVDDELAIFRLGERERLEILKGRLSRGEIMQIEYVRDAARIRVEGVTDEQRLTKRLLENDKLNGEERAAILRQLKTLEIELRIEKLKGGTEINEQVKREIADTEALLAVAKKEADAEEKRSRAIRDRRNQLSGQSQIDSHQAEQERLAVQRSSTMGAGVGDDYSMRDLMATKEIANSQGAIAGIEALRNAFSGLGQAIGQAVQAWTLYGNIGGGARKVAAQIIASVAQMAAVKAIFEVAEGLAALAKGWLFGDAKAFAAATLHFKSAAAYGIVAGVAAAAGRVTAGDQFNSQTAGATGGGANNKQGDGAPQGSLSSGGAVNLGNSGNGNGSRSTDNILGRIADALDRNTMATAQSEETSNKLYRHVDTMPEGVIVKRGLDQAPRAAYDATNRAIEESGAETLMRNMGFAA